MRALVFLACLAAAPALAAPDHAAIARRTLDAHILPGYAAFAQATAALADTAAARCGGTADGAAVAAAYHSAFDAWMGVGHLRFGPVETDGRVTAIAYWPDAKGFTPRSLTRLIAEQDPVVDDPAAFAEVSVAARGLFALDWLLFDAAAPDAGQGYPCRLAAAITVDLAATAGAVAAEWRDGYGATFVSAGAPDNAVYHAAEEPTRALYGALTAGLEAVIDLRYGRPLGTFDRPQPRRAEAWRSGRPLRDAALSLAALRDLAETAFLPELPAEDASDVRAAFDRAVVEAERAPAPMVESVADPARRIAIESAQRAARDALDAVRARIGPALGVVAGFNSQDGD